MRDSLGRMVIVTSLVLVLTVVTVGLRVAETEASTSATTTLCTSAQWAPDLGPVASLQIPVARYDERECAACVSDCLYLTGSSYGTCFSFWCYAECSD